MAKDTLELANELRAIAATLEQLGEGFYPNPDQPFTYEGVCGSSRFKLKMDWNPDSIRNRADRLETQAKRSYQSQGYRKSRIKKHASTKRPGYNKALANEFLLAGEHDNYQAYQELYGQDPTIPRR
jgi:hypothetical protein